MLVRVMDNMSHIAFSGQFYVLRQSVQLLSHVRLLVTPPHGLQHARLPCPSPSPGVLTHQCMLTSRGDRLTFSELHLFFPCSKAGVILQ